MSVPKILNGNPMYISVICGLIFIFCLCFVFLKKAWDQAIVLGYSKDTLKKVVKSSIVYSVVPSLSIVIALFSLSSVLGVPWSWFRLSVVGSLGYELMAAEMSVTGAGYESLGEFISSGDISVIGTIMFVMSISIIGGNVFNTIFGKKLQGSMIKYQQKNAEWGTLAMSYFTLSMAIVFLPIQLTKSSVHFATLLTSAAITLIHMIIIKRYNVKWLREFVLANTLILSMISAVFWESLLS